MLVTMLYRSVTAFYIMVAMGCLQPTVSVQLSLPPTSIPLVPSNKHSSLLETTIAIIPNSRSFLKWYLTKIQAISRFLKLDFFYNSHVIAYRAATQNSPTTSAGSLGQSEMEKEYCHLMQEFWQRLLTIGNYGIATGIVNGAKGLEK